MSNYLLRNNMKKKNWMSRKTFRLIATNFTVESGRTYLSDWLPNIKLDVWDDVTCECAIRRVTFLGLRQHVLEWNACGDIYLTRYYIACHQWWLPNIRLWTRFNRQVYDGNKLTIQS